MTVPIAHKHFTRQRRLKFVHKTILCILGIIYLAYFATAQWLISYIAGHLPAASGLSEFEKFPFKRLREGARSKF